jgi:hypothetical protein
MAYIYTTFGEITLPIYNRESDLSPAPAMTRFVQTANGVFDADGNGRSLRRYPHMLTIDAVVSENTPTAQRAAIDALRAAVGTRALLTRKADSDGAEHVASCRLIQMTQMRSYGQRGYQPVRLQFAQLTPWRATLPTTYVFQVPQSLSPVEVTGTIINSGNLPVTAVTMRIDIGMGMEYGGFISNPRWSNATHDIKIDGVTFDSVFPFFVIVDGETYSVMYERPSRPPDVPTYRISYRNYLKINAGHAIDSWFRLEPGSQTMTLSASLAHAYGTNHSVTWTVSFYAEYA